MAKELPFAITVCDTQGIILFMNDRAIETFQKYGGADLVGQSLYDCHSPKSGEAIRKMIEEDSSNAYTIEKEGKKKLIYQSPWYKEGKVAGLIELSLVIPFEMENFVRS